ncbi:hypothetical protein HY792_06320 [Candidatus Desantisbacteria bacterium]|nr:hypothetical protein [Candidatus Desantisbacteria bacterium]
MSWDGGSLLGDSDGAGNGGGGGNGIVVVCSVSLNLLPEIIGLAEPIHLIPASAKSSNADKEMVGDVE